MIPPWLICSAFDFHRALRSHTSKNPFPRPHGRRRCQVAMTTTAPNAKLRAFDWSLILSSSSSASPECCFPFLSLAGFDRFCGKISAAWFIKFVSDAWEKSFTFAPVDEKRFIKISFLAEVVWRSDRGRVRGWFRRQFWKIYQFGREIKLKMFAIARHASPSADKIMNSIKSAVSSSATKTLTFKSCEMCASKSVMRKH